MKIMCVIPSRIGSTRLARKALLPIQGKPMVQRVYENASHCSLFNKVVVATDSDEIAEVIHKINGHALITSSSFVTGSDRVASVAEQFPEMDVIVNLQGDEPFIGSAMLETLLRPFLRDEKPVMSTLAHPLDKKDYDNPGVVKVILNQLGDAIYFSRAPIPYFREAIDTSPVYHHKGVYAFQRDFLLEYQNLPQTPLEKIESLEQLRALEHGFKIKVCITPYKTLEINTEEEYNHAQEWQDDYTYSS